VLSGFAASVAPASADYCGDRFDRSGLGRAAVDPQGACSAFASVELRYGSRYSEIIMMQDAARPIPPTRAAELVAIMNDVAAATGRGLTALGGMQLPGVVHIVFVPQPDTRARMRTVDQSYLRLGTRERDCPMIVYGNGEGLSPGRMRRTFAHELFHCAQYETFYAKARDDASLWWREGTAEWFEDFAFPALAAESDLTDVIRVYNERHRELAMHEMTYAPAVFFAWLGRARPGAIVTYLTQMANEGEPQTEAMARALTAERYQAFAQAYEDDEITFPSGTRVVSPEIASAAAATTGNPESDPDIRKQARKAFTVQREKIEFVPGEYSPEGAAGTLDRVFSERPGTWAKLPARLVVRCGERKMFRAVTMPMRDDPPPLLVKPGTTKAMQCGECGATGGGVRRAGCVVGSWRMVPGSGNCHILGSMMAGTGVSVDVEECRPGEATATFNPDGTFGGMLQNAKRRVSMQFPGGRSGGEAPRMTAENFIVLAKSAGLWKATEDSGDLELCSTTTTGMGSIKMSGIGATRTRPMSFGPSAYVKLNYTCAGDAMTITVPSQGGGMPAFSVQAERVRPAR
jgi:hypothetical protein